MAKLIDLETRLAGGEGTRYISGVAEVTGLRNYAVIPRENTTITSITGEDASGNPVDVLAQFGLTVAITLLKDELWVCDANVVITAIKLASGTVRLN